MSLSRRDVDLPRRDVNFTPLCYVVTWNSHVATSNYPLSITSRSGSSTSRRQIVPLCHVATWISNVATWLIITLCNVATLPRTSRRWLHYSLSRRDVGPHVATWPCFKPKISSFLALHLTQPTNQNPSLPAHLPSPDLPEPFPTLVGGPTLFSDHHCAPTCHPFYLVPGHCGIPITLCPVLASGSFSRVSLYSRLV